MTHFDLVIFDCDGVLVDSERVIAKVCVRELALCGWSMSEQQFATRFVGRSRDVWKSEVRIRLGDVASEQWFEHVDKEIETALEKDLVPVSGVIEVLSDLNLPVCVASNSNHARIESALQKTALWPYFAGRCFSSDDVDYGKPSPDLFLYAAKSCGVSPAECAVVEDSPAGVEAAMAAGMKCFVYTGGLIDATRLSKVDAIPFNDMRHLKQLLG
ncbi:MAG: HAD family hydrolase [Streptosporangiaceae bacterium]